MPMFSEYLWYPRPSIPVAALTTPVPEPERPPLPAEPVLPIPKPTEPFKVSTEPFKVSTEPFKVSTEPFKVSSEPFKVSEEPNIFLEKPSFLPAPKPILHSPKISPSSIPNPSPSVTTTSKPVEPYPNFGSYLYNIPGYSAFQPVSYPGIVQPNQAPLQLAPPEPPPTDFVPFPTIAAKEAPPPPSIEEKNIVEVKPANEPPRNPTPVETPKAQTDFEDHFTPEIIPASSMSIDTGQSSECKMSITSLTQGSGATVTIPSQVTSKESKIKPAERFSLKTSIPISKIDLKCVSTPSDTVLQNPITKKMAASQQYHSQKSDNGPRVEIQSNIVIKSAKEPEPVEPKPPNNSISTLINAAEAIHKSEIQFRKPDINPIDMTNDAKDTSPQFTPQPTNLMTRPIFNSVNVDSNKVNYSNKPPDLSFNEQKNQIVFIQNKNPTNPKMLLTIQQPNPQVLLQRTNFESKNLQAPSRLSSQSKKCKEELVSENGSSSKVVALKRLHQENCDENDFENLITENQIYGNKIVVKEKSQGTQQEQDLKNKVRLEKPIQNETKNVVLQPVVQQNFVYLSNVQFPTNLMMIKSNNTKVSQGTDTNTTSIKPNKISPNENKNIEFIQPAKKSINNANNKVKSVKPQNAAVNKDIHVLKSSNNVMQTPISNKNTKSDITIIETNNQNINLNPQLIYDLPVIVDADIQLDQPNYDIQIETEFPKFVANQNMNELVQTVEPPESNDKLFIACPYQMDSNLQPTIVITNVRPPTETVSVKVDELSSLDIYEKRRRLRRLKYLSNRETNKEQKTDEKDKEKEKKKVQEKTEKSNIITAKTMKAEIYKELKAKACLEEENNESDSEYGEEELMEYNEIIKKYGKRKKEDKIGGGKLAFLSGFRLASKEAYKEKQMDKQERMLRRDSVASAYIAAGRIDRLTHESKSSESQPEFAKPAPPSKTQGPEVVESPEEKYKKNWFLSQLRLMTVPSHYKERYERVWHEILKERKRRDRPTEDPSAEDAEVFKKPRPVDLDPNGQLQLLTEIKKCVNENNNLIKKRLEVTTTEKEGESIKVLADKNFSELNRLSKMADRSVKVFTGQEARKRDLNPGFDSENIQIPQIRIKSKNFVDINIPCISKIVSLKSRQEKDLAQSSQATSMDEPQSSAAGATESKDGEEPKTKDFSCQAEELWPGLKKLVRNIKQYEIVRKKEIVDLHRRNTELRVESAYVTRNASHDNDQARALLAERQNLSVEEANIRRSVQKLIAAIEVIRNS
ncbi:uncharacterized protein LOC114357446 [Ostrinia furnacalis]|uniref:uncharacterized protein LOC114357446 n=1 Tax=Ostrinia furnacalis TaxID=93504 RepID=UPI00104010BD|nr:uncharacterized protein LOC114357446 [Ostrinia furnacalis]